MKYRNEGPETHPLFLKHVIFKKGVRERLEGGGRVNDIDSTGTRNHGKEGWDWTWKVGRERQRDMAAMFTT